MSEIEVIEYRRERIADCWPWCESSGATAAPRPARTRSLHAGWGQNPIQPHARSRNRLISSRAATKRINDVAVRVPKILTRSFRKFWPGRRS